MKEILKKYKFLVVVLILVVLVAIRFLLTDRFKQGAEKNAIPAFTHSNVMQSSNPKFMAATSLIVYIDSPKQRFSAHSNILAINSSDILTKSTLQAIKKSERAILVSDDPSLSARCWMLMAQKGVTNHFAYFTGDEEDFKYQFQPDTNSYH
ncbi:MAG: hypothetical protein JXR22_05655 [Prolixibacteraceae bacterium]|nr:hypothetical protein [Prolixibacteraceae bacterium]